MTTYSTGNPIGSTAVQDLYDNAENLDVLVNDRTAREHPDRLGKSRKTWWGMEQDFQDFLLNSGYEQIGDYGPGLEITSRNQVFWRDGELYRAGASLELPYTTTGDWITEEGLFVASGDQVLRQQLADDGDPSNGAAIVAGAAQLVPSVAALRQAKKTSPSTKAQTTGYHSEGDGGAALYYLDLTDTTSVDNGGSVIVAIDGGRWKIAPSGPVSVKQFGARGDDFTNNDDAFAKARAWVAANPVRNKLVFPAGIYRYSVSPNWAIQNAQVQAEGEVRLRYTGTGDAFILDSDAPDAVCFVPGLCNNVRIGRLIIEAPASAKNGVLVRSIHHSELDFYVRGAGATYAGVRVEFAVCTDFKRTTVSVNEEGWYQAAKPKYGVFLTRRNEEEETSYCTFSNPILEATEIGAYLEWALGNLFIGGTMEGCTDTGVVIAENSRLNKFLNVDFEANTSADINCAGYENEFHACDSELYALVSATGRRNKFIGGVYNNFGITAGATDNKLIGFDYNRFNSGAGVSDSGTRTRMRDLLNRGSGLVHNAVPSYAVIGAPASGAEYVNETGNDVTIAISGGTVSYIGHNRNGSGNSTGFTSGQVTLSPGDGLTIVYTVAPTLTRYSR